MAKLKWLYPGLKVKRWLFLAFLGFIMILSGVTVVIGPLNLASISRESFIILSELFGMHSRYNGLIIALIGLFFVWLGIKKAFRSIISILLPQDEGRLAEILYNRRQMKKGPKVLAIGGGTGLPAVLRGLKPYTGNITAVVAVSDDGGSSGKLRGELDMLPPGDVRNCLLALADTEPLLEQIFEHRFTKGKELAGHNVGNLIIAALNENLGFLESIKALSKILAVKGKVLPVTDKPLTIEALYESGRKEKGESQIPNPGEKIKSIKIKDDNVKLLPEVMEAIREADAIIIGPGSLYTSIIPNLLVPGIVEEIEKSKAPKIWVANIMTQPGETDNYSLSNHLEVFKEHTGSYLVNTVVANRHKKFNQKALKKYQEEGQVPVKIDKENLNELNKIKILSGDFALDSSLIRHNHEALGRAIMKEIVSEKLKSDLNLSTLSLSGLIRANDKKASNFLRR
ncbi:gluconeogenesis factor YvcK family protein [Natranaerofaba carboxydovora]|uniref:gluconeogenesis factor YvcK family protein n=1 Tax=Natranaerofaba carboxydovora TaxID=2742683 RepID=UPI001F13D471|nr:YvcK family protein [Natranaerofaba carboxydovora]UMZ72653.1 Gluconeogenesis factor [Natranaerofaba carboxydovora]